MAKSKKIKAEEEIKEENVDLEKDEKDLDVKEEAPKAEEVTEEVTEEAPEAEKEDLIVLTDGSTAEEHVKLEEEEADDLTKITKADGTELFVETPEGTAEENKEVYEAIIEAETPAEEAAEGLEEEVNAPEVMDEIEEVGYVPAACHTAHASLNNSYYILKLKGGKLKALKAGKILNKELKASIIKAHKEGKKLPEAETVFNKIAAKVGYTMQAFTKLASKLSKKAYVGYDAKPENKEEKIAVRIGDKLIDIVNNVWDNNNISSDSRVPKEHEAIVKMEADAIKAFLARNINMKNKDIINLVHEHLEDNNFHTTEEALESLGFHRTATKKVVATELPDTIPGTDNDKAEMLKNFSIDEADIKKDNIDSTVALEKAELEEGKDGVKAAPSKVKSLYNRLPGKSGVSEDVDWSMKDFNKERNKADKTLASQIKALRDATKEIRAQKEVLASKDAEIKALQEKLAAMNSKEETMIKSAKINKIIASMNITDDEEKAAMTEKFAKYTKAQLDAVYETMTACPSEEATIMHERMINEEMKKEASALKGFVPSFKLEEEVKTSTSDEMEKLVLERELDSIGQ